MSIEQNIELVKRHFQNEVLGDSAAVLAEMTDDCHYYMRPIFDECIDDKAQITAIHNGLSTAFADMYIDIKHIFATDERCAAEAVMGGKHVGEWDGIPATGKDIHFHAGVFFEIHDDKIVNESIYFDRREILRQLDIKETLEL
jgi:steroid delta-isomerase-like uncharacterized protein